MRTLRLLSASLLCSSLLFFSACESKKAKIETQPAPPQFKVSMTTTKGEIVLLVHRDWSPLGADRFYDLAKMGFYDDNRFFRVLKGFIVQWGVNGDPKINKSWSEIPIKDDPPKVENKVGTVVFAAAGPNSRTTQVFINLADNSRSLDPQGFTPFGEVIAGLDNVQNLYGGYGEGAPQGGGPDQAAIADIGTPYLEEHFPKLDYIKKAKIVP